MTFDIESEVFTACSEFGPHSFHLEEERFISPEMCRTSRQIRMGSNQNWRANRPGLEDPHILFPKATGFTDPKATPEKAGSRLSQSHGVSHSEQS